MEILSLAIIGLLIVISPGADFVLILRNSISAGRGAGIFTACGISLAIGFHISYSMLGISYLISQNIMLFTLVKYAGAAYLIYVGVQGILTANNNIDVIKNDEVKIKPLQYLLQGFLCNALNPKTMLFFISLFSQLVSSDINSTGYALAYGLYISILHGVWFSLVAIIFTSTLLQNRLSKMKKRLNQLCGLGLVSFGLVLAIKT